MKEKKFPENEPTPFTKQVTSFSAMKARLNITRNLRIAKYFESAACISGSINACHCKMDRDIPAWLFLPSRLPSARRSVRGIEHPLEFDGGASAIQSFVRGEHSATSCAEAMPAAHSPAATRPLAFEEISASCVMHENFLRMRSCHVGNSATLPLKSRRFGCPAVLGAKG
jgi:hypothetical protein